LVVSSDALMPVVLLLERATGPQIDAFALLLQQVLRMWRMARCPGNTIPS
jgi:hypothetical protein